MSLVEINWHPERKQLKSFGKTALIATTIISLLLYLFKSGAIQWALIIFAAGVIIFLNSYISLKLTRMIYIVLMVMTLPIGLFVSFMLLSSFYFLLLTPVGILFRLINRDVLGRKFESKMNSYWRKMKAPESTERYYHQF
jgi:hypothetical protein